MRIKKNDIISLNKGISNDLKKKVVEQDEQIDSLQNDTLKSVVTEMINATNKKVVDNNTSAKSKSTMKKQQKDR